MRIIVDGSDEAFAWAIRSLTSRGFDVMAAIDRNATDAEILWTGITTRIDELVTKVYPSLRYVCCPATGIDHIDVAGLNARGVKVLSLRDCMDVIQGVSATAEFTLYLILSSLRPTHTPKGYRQIGRDLKGKRVLVIGYGRIGKQVAKLCEAFGCIVDAIDIGDRFRLNEALSLADIVTLHVSLTPESEGMIGAVQFAAMKRNSILINTSRGKVIDEAALVHALTHGNTVRHAALDVHANEPGEPSPDIKRLAGTCLLTLTSHLGGYTVESRAATDRVLVECLIKQIEADRGKD